MLAKIAPPSHDFLALARYLIHGKPGTTPHPDRVAWLKTRNLPTDDPELAAKLMTATADLSARTKLPAYHLMIAWHPCEHPSPEIMQEIARLTLERADLSEHQALLVGHGDTDHLHLHMLINRVHPDTGHAWKTSHDFARFDRIMRDLSEAYGFAFIPAHRFNPEETHHLPKKPNSKATYAAKRGTPTTRLQMSQDATDDLANRLAEDMDQHSTWDDIETALAQHDLTLEPKGGGFVVGNAHHYAKLSKLRLSYAALEFSRRRSANPTFRKPAIADITKSAPAQCRLNVFTVDAIDIKRALASFGFATEAEIRSAIAEAQATREARRTTSLTAHVSYVSMQSTAYLKGRNIDRSTDRAQPSR